MSDQVPLSLQKIYPIDSTQTQNFSANYNNDTQQQYTPFSLNSSSGQQSGQVMHGQSPSVGPQLAPDNRAQSDLAEAEKEAARLRELSSQLDSIQGLNQQPPTDDDASKADVDSRSVYIGNVDYGTTPIELEQHFAVSGAIERVTIMTNKQTGQPKGFAYMEFKSNEDAARAVQMLDGSMFRDRELKVNLKRTNVPGLSKTNRGGGFRGRGRGRGRGMMMGGRGRGGFRGRGGPIRGASRFSPY